MTASIDAMDNGGAPRTRKVVVMAFDGATLLDVVSSAEVFDIAAKQVLSPADGRYEFVIASSRGGGVRAASGLRLDTVAWHEVTGPIDTIIVPGGGPPHAPPVPQDVVDQLRRWAPQARRLCAICTGTFILAAAGLTEGRRVTTHWQAVDQLAERFPTTRVDGDPIFVRDGPVWTSAGFTAGIDVALALIEQDVGHEAAIHLARLLVMFLKRPGGQSQFSAPLAAQAATDKSFAALHAWISENLDGDLSIDGLARQAKMAPRTFARHYVEKVGRTPAKTVGTLRLDAACRFLTTTDASLKDIALRTGYHDEQNMRRAFQRAFGTSPYEYRQRFSAKSLAH